MRLDGLAGLMNAGRYPEAEREARTLLDRGADSGALWKLHGASLYLQGKDAVASLREALKRLAGDAEVLMFLGGAHHDRGEWQESADYLRRALQIEPASAQCHDGLGLALLEMGRREEAIAAFEAALRLEPRYAQALAHLGNALLDAQFFERAAQTFRTLVELEPRAAEAHNGLGNALLALRHLAPAAACYRRALELRPEATGALTNLASVLRDLGAIQESIVCCERALALAPDEAEAQRLLGNALFDLGRFDDAEHHYRRALELEPGYARGHATLAMLLRQIGRTRDAEVHCRRALALDAASAEALALLGEIEADQGDFEAAGRAFDQALQVDPRLPEGWAGRIRYRRMQQADREWIGRVRSLLDGPLPARHHVILGHALGKFFDDVGDADEAFAHHRHANEMSKRLGLPHDRDQLAARTAHVLRTYDRAWLETLRGAGHGTERPVFVVGMPRSGTTLVEQILASHPSAFGAGELPYWHGATARFEATPSKPDPRRLRDLADGYLELLHGKSPDATRMVDKMPANTWNLGLIHAALPRARIIHVQRHPLDTCLSIYFQVFSAAHGYACDLQDLAHYYEQYRRLMEHWRGLLPPESLLEVHYESLVEDPEGWTRRLVQFAGLDWDPACLQFHATRRVVQTASNWQVRQKINAASVGRWRSYRHLLGPLLRLVPSEAGEAVA
jgi:tetratricopeptide (TPR) repeat protein